MPYVQLLADFRDEVRNVAREEKGNAKRFVPLFVLLLPHSELLKRHCYFSFPVTRILDACDELRDVSLPELGVKLEDVEGKYQ